MKKKFFDDKKKEREKMEKWKEIKLPDNAGIVYFKNENKNLFYDKEIEKIYNEKYEHCNSIVFSAMHTLENILQKRHNFNMLDNNIRMIQLRKIAEVLSIIHNRKDFIQLFSEIGSLIDLSPENLNNISSIQYAAFLCLFMSEFMLNNKNREDIKLKTMSIRIANQIDDSLIRVGLFKNDTRGELLNIMTQQIQSSYVVYYFSHEDLVVKFKSGVYCLELDDFRCKVKGLDILNALPDAIKKRMQVTSVSREDRTMPSGQPVFERRWADHTFTYEDISVGVRYRSLERLLAQNYFELGRAYTLSPVGLQKKNLEKAMEYFSLSRNIYMKFKKPDYLRAIICYISEIRSKNNWLKNFKKQASNEDYLIELNQLFILFTKASEMINDYSELIKKDGKDTKDIELLKLMAFCYSSIGYDFVCYAQFIKKIITFDEYQEYIVDTCQDLFIKANQFKNNNPWISFACIKALDDFYYKHKIENKDSPVIQFYEDHVSDIQVLLLDAIQSAQETNDVFPNMLINKMDDESPDVRVPHRLPVNTLDFYYDVLTETFSTSLSSERLLNKKQLDILLPWIIHIVPCNFKVSKFIYFCDLELDLLKKSCQEKTLTLPEVTDYVRQRIEMLEDQIRLPYISYSEKGLISQSISKLVIHIESISSFFKDIDNIEDILFYAERRGASRFRSNLKLFHCRNKDHLPLFLQLSPFNIYSEYQMNYERLSHYMEVKERYKYVKKVKDDPPLYNKEIQYLNDFLSTEKKSIFHRSLKDKIFILTGVPENEWQYVDDKIIVSEPVPSYETSAEKVEQYRRAIMQDTEVLLGSELFDQIMDIPKANTRNLYQYFNNNPQRVCIYVGMIHAGLPLTVFYLNKNKLAVEHLHFNKDDTEDIGAHIGFGAYIQGWCLQYESIEIQRKMDEAFKSIVQSHGNKLAQKIYQLMKRLDKKEIIFVRNLMFENMIPWESLPLENDTLLGDIFPIAFVYTLSSIQSDDYQKEKTRDLTFHIGGSVLDNDQMNPGISVLKQLTKVSTKNVYIKGSSFDISNISFICELQKARVLRFFVHGYECYDKPFNSRLILHKGCDNLNSKNLIADNIKLLPIYGLDCAELFACEASSVGKLYTEFGLIEEPEGINTAFLYAGVKRILSSRYEVPILPTVLIMERYALECEKTRSVIKALSKAKNWYHISFKKGGFCEKDLVERLMKAFLPQKSSSFYARQEQLETMKYSHFLKTIHALRIQMYKDFNRSPPMELHFSRGMDKLWGFADKEKIHDRIAQGMETNPLKEISAMVQQLLYQYRNPSSYAAWQVTLQDKEYFR